MASLILKNLISSDNVIMFETNEGLQVGHVESSDMKNTITDYNLIVSGNVSIPLNNMYPLSSFIIQSYQYEKIPSERQNNINDFLNIYAPDTTYVKGCQFFNYGYLLSDLTDKSISVDSMSFSGDIFSTSYTTKTEMPIDTYVYSSLDKITSSPYASTGTVCGEYTAIPLYDLSGVRFNFINECPLEFKYSGYNVDSTSAYSYIFADSVNAKNNYNYNYSVESIVTSSVNISAVNAELRNAREYYNIGTTGDLLYMIYKTNKHYASPSSVSLSSNITNVTFGMNPTSAFATSGSIIKIPMSTMTSLSSNIYEQYDNVETIYSINRIKEPITHKSNLYSINIQNANINSSDLTDVDKTTLKRNLSNIMENMIKNISPANTQLFKIYWNGQ